MTYFGGSRNGRFGAANRGKRSFVQLNHDGSYAQTPPIETAAEWLKSGRTFRLTIEPALALNLLIEAAVDGREAAIRSGTQTLRICAKRHQFYVVGPRQGQNI